MPFDSRAENGLVAIPHGRVTRPKDWPSATEQLCTPNPTPPNSAAHRGRKVGRCPFE